MEAIKSYNLKKSAAAQTAYMGILFIVCGIMILLLTQRLLLFFFIFGIIGIVMYSVNRKLQVIKIYPKHFEYKPGLAARSRLVKIDKYEQFEEKGKTLHIHYKNENDQQKIVKLRRGTLEKADYESFKEYLSEL